MIGRTLGHYRVLDHIDAGGMGEVYRAYDQRLERDVALKVLPSEVVADEEARRRLRREALALSRLNHPHVAIIHDFDSQDGSDFIVMELLEGETLAARLARGPLSEVEAVRLGLQIADALEAAHRSGVIHRDLKPGNLFVTARGDLKVLDFGLAKPVHRDTGESAATVTMLTQPQQVVGTLAYMAPEQLKGEEVDARTDLYALGAVLYEMVVGRPPFEQESSMALAGMILNSPAPSPRQRRRGVSTELERVILRCLEKEPGKRYGSAAAVMAALKPLVKPGAEVTLRRVALPAAAALLVVAVGIFVLDVGGLRQRLMPPPVRTLAVLPLENLSRDPDQEYFAEGLTEELISVLGNIGSLRVISRESAMSFRGTPKRLPEIARELRVDNLVLGSVQRVADRVRIRVRLVKGADERQLWSSSYDSGLADVLALQSQIAQAVAKELRALVTPGERGRLQVAPSMSPEAHEAYLRGRYHVSRFTEPDFRKALQYFQEAVRLDPTSALAYAGLADGYYVGSSIWMSANEAMPRSRAAALRALEFDSTLAEARNALATVRGFYEWNWAEAERGFRKAMELKPGYAPAHLLLGIMLTAQARFDEAIQEMDIAWKLDPLSSMVGSFRLFPLNYAGRDEEVIRGARELIRSDSASWNPHLVLGQVLLRKRTFPEALMELREASRLSGSSSAQAWVSYGYAMAGKHDSAQIVRRQLEEQSRHSFVSPYAMAVVYAGLSERDLAISQLRAALIQRSEDLAFINIDPAMDPLRSDPRFAEIVRKVGLTP